jgi:hypothetical protein
VLVVGGENGVNHGNVRLGIVKLETAMDAMIRKAMKTPAVAYKPIFFPLFAISLCSFYPSLLPHFGHLPKLIPQVKQYHAPHFGQ